MNRSQKFIIVLAVILNFLISYLCLLHQQPINVDGIRYLNAAQAYLDHGFKAAAAAYPWPVYSIFIAITSQMTHLSLLYSGFLLNAVLTSLLIVTFIILIKEMGGNRLQQYLGLIIILIYPYLNHDRYNILRDFGYYAFFLLSFLYLLRYLRQLHWRDAIGFTISLIIAIVFRIEGILLLCFAPLITLFKPELNLPRKLLVTLKLYTPSVILFSCALALIIFKYHITQDSLNRINIFFTVLLQGPGVILHNFAAKQIIIQQNLLDTFGQDAAGVFLIGGIIAIFINSFFYTLGIIYALLVIFALCSKKITIEKNARLALISYITICCLTLLGFILEELFLTGRYITPLCLLLILLVPFSLTVLMQNYFDNKKRVWIPIFIFASLLYIVIESFWHFSTSKTYIISAGDWLKNHTAITSRVYSNDPTLAFYSYRPGSPYSGIPSDPNWLMTLQKTHLNDFDYVALVIHNDELDKETQVENWLKIKPIQSWHNNFGDEAVIFLLPFGKKVPKADEGVVKKPSP